MGADLLLTTLMHEVDARLDWPAGRAAARAMTANEVTTFCEETFGYVSDSMAEMRSQVNLVLSELKAELKTPGRDAHIWDVRGVRLHIRGGTSWGDDPSNGWTIFANAHYLPWRVLEAIGFEATDVIRE